MDLEKGSDNLWVEISIMSHSECRPKGFAWNLILSFTDFLGHAEAPNIFISIICSVLWLGRVLNW